ncbi:Protein NDRG3 [Liparis tanakae]|uniref:Protein NDRG3 n=1 Tax=Liparis tanakae TaxID=230148 RepID=A0A4Z2GV75_9TELE|nr:Protein NDRG3 [Liparis tanakae]
MALIFNTSVCVTGCEHDVKKAHAVLHVTMRGVARGNRPTILTYHVIALNRETVHEGAEPHLDEVQFEVLGHLVGLADPEDVPDDVLRGVAQRPQLLHHLVGLVDVPVHAVSQHAFHQQRVGLVAHFEHVVAVDVAEAGVGGLQVVQRLEDGTESQRRTGQEVRGGRERKSVEDGTGSQLRIGQEVSGRRNRKSVKDGTGCQWMT